MRMTSPSRSAPASPNQRPMCSGSVMMSQTRSIGAAMKVSRSMKSIMSTQGQDERLGWGEQADREPARPEAARHDQMPPVLDDVPARVALAVVGRQQRAPQQRDRDLAAMRVARERQRDARRHPGEQVRVV